MRASDAGECVLRLHIILGAAQCTCADIAADAPGMACEGIVFSEEAFLRLPLM